MKDYADLGQADEGQGTDEPFSCLRSRTMPVGIPTELEVSKNENRCEKMSLIWIYRKFMVGLGGAHRKRFKYADDSKEKPLHQIDLSSSH